MRRQTTKQPSGPAVSATPMPAISARMKKSSSTLFSMPMGVIAMVMAVIVVVVTMIVMMIIVGVMVPILMMVAIIWVAMIGDRAVAMHDASIRQVGVVVMMAVDRECAGIAE